VTLSDNGGADAAGVWGLVFDGGRAVVGQIESGSDEQIVRSLLEITGGLTPGTEVSLDAAVWGADALDRFGLTEEPISGPDGPLALWTAPGVDDTWVIFVHGNGADQTQALRMVPAVMAAGYPVAVASYRNDEGAAPSPSGRHGFGYDEWRDVQSVIDYGLGAGALDFVLVGYGSGGSIVGTYLYESRSADRILGVVLDSPMLSLATAIQGAWTDRGVPGWAIGWTKAIASMRFGLDLGAIDHVDRAAEWTAPVLILHGRDDEVNPLDAVAAFAIERGDDALLLTFPGAGSDALWNIDPIRYEAAFIGFVDEVAAAVSAFEPVDPGR
jgi:alpha-beta hydrolase superfamily lysophospholipase